MKYYISVFITLLTYLFSPQLEALMRDYCSDSEKDKAHHYEMTPRCLYHGIDHLPEDIPVYLLVGIEQSVEIATGHQSTQDI